MLWSCQAARPIAGTVILHNTNQGCIEIEVVFFVHPFTFENFTFLDQLMKVTDILVNLAFNNHAVLQFCSITGNNLK